MVASRVALPVTALSVLGIKAGHILAPIGPMFVAFLWKPNHVAKPSEWLLLAALIVGIGLAAASCWRAPRVLVALSIICLATTTVMACLEWGFIDPELFACSSIPFLLASVFALIFSPSRE